MASDSAGGASSLAQDTKTYVGRAFALGWHVAELTHLQDDGEKLTGPGSLAQVINLSYTARAELMLGQINHGLAQINAALAPGRIKMPSGIRGLEKLERAPTGEDLRGVSGAHEALLAELTAADYRLGKAYSLGAQLGETVILGYRELKDKPNEGDLPELFAGKKIAALAGQLRDLKTAFADHAADAVATTLLDWSDTVTIWSKPLEDAADAGTDPAKFAEAAMARRFVLANRLYRQGTAWRALLSGEKEATDFLHLIDYARAIGELLGEYAALTRSIGLRGPTLAVLAVMVVVVVAGAGVLAWVFRAQVQAVYTLLVGLLAALGITGATITAGVKRALTTAEDTLWQTELTIAIADAIDMVPVQDPHSNIASLRLPRREPPMLGSQRVLKVSGEQRLSGRPVLLGKWVGICIVLGLAVIGASAYLQVKAGVSWIDAVSVSASAAACYIVSLLALIAVLNFVAWKRKTPYIWVLPTDIPRFRTDWLVPVAVAVGVVIGKLLWT